MVIEIIIESSFIELLYIPDVEIQQFFAVQKKESPNVRCDRWTLLNLYYENFVFINRNFFTIGQLNKPFCAIVINDDAVAVTLLRE